MKSPARDLADFYLHTVRSSHSLNGMSYCVRFVASKGKLRPDYLRFRGRPARADSWAVVVRVNRSLCYYSGGWASEAQAARHADTARHYLIFREMLDVRFVKFNFPETPFDSSLVCPSLREFVSKNKIII